MFMFFVLVLECKILRIACIIIDMTLVNPTFHSKYVQYTLQRIVRNRKTQLLETPGD